MHEASIAQSLIEKTLNTVNKNKLKKVNTINLKIGKLHHIVPEVLINYFNLLKQEYNQLCSSKIIINQPDIIIKCNKCGKKSKIDEPLFICTFCGSPSTKIIQGNELHLMRIEGEK